MKNNDILIYEEGVIKKKAFEKPTSFSKQQKRIILYRTLFNKRDKAQIAWQHITTRKAYWILNLQLFCLLLNWIDPMDGQLCPLHF